MRVHVCLCVCWGGWETWSSKCINGKDTRRLEIPHVVEFWASRKNTHFFPLRVFSLTTVGVIYHPFCLPLPHWGWGVSSIANCTCLGSASPNCDVCRKKNATCLDCVLFQMPISPSASLCRLFLNCSNIWWLVGADSRWHALIASSVVQSQQLEQQFSTPTRLYNGIMLSRRAAWPITHCLWSPPHPDNRINRLNCIFRRTLLGVDGRAESC